MRRYKYLEKMLIEEMMKILVYLKVELCYNKNFMKINIFRDSLRNTDQDWLR